MNEHTIHALEQGRAACAYNHVKKIFDLDPNQKDPRQKKYKTGAKKLPVLIKTNGLGQALAYIQIRNRDLYSNLMDWLCDKELIEASGDLVSQVINMKSNEYRRLTTECLAYLNWVRRFVDSLMPKVEGEDSP